MSAPRPLPDGTLVAFYGDDFTGSSASMEVLAFAGLPTVLFLEPPSPERLAAFAGYRAIGIAGTARSRSPDWMNAHLPGAFRLLGSLGAPVVHYKVCSTFDSAPGIGSIGRATEIGIDVFAPSWVPLVVGEPGMGRYQSFGHLFAMAGGAGFRLDRHPTMSRHPTTPMDEADLGRHLARQTDLAVGLVDFVAMKRGDGDAALARALADGARIVSLDVLDRETLTEAGRLVWERDAPSFGVGSQGFEAALVAYWRSVGLVPAEPAIARPGPVARMAAVSGSVSPVTAGQIAHAVENGFAAIRLDAARVVDPAAWPGELARAREAALAAIGTGRDPLVFTASGPDDPAVPALNEAIARSGLSSEAANDRLGAGLGAILRDVVARAGLRRAVISGGDTSGRAAAMLGIDALTALSPLDPGSPLCRAHAAPQTDGPPGGFDGPPGGFDGRPGGFDGLPGGFNGLEIALKGGQVGRPDFFTAARQGGRA